MKRKIKLISILLALFLSIGLIGCSSSNDDEADSSQENKTLPLRMKRQLQP